MLINYFINMSHKIAKCAKKQTEGVIRYLEPNKC